MKLTKTYTLYTFLILVLTVLLMMGVWFGIKTDEHRNILKEQWSAFERYQSVLELESRLIRKTVYDYAALDALQAFIVSNDTAWGHSHLEPLLKRLDVDAILLFNARKELIYRFDTSVAYTIPDLHRFSTPMPSFKEFFSLDAQTRLNQYFLAPLYAHNASDEHPIGFFVIVRQWDQAFFHEIAKLTRAQTAIIPPLSDKEQREMPFLLPLKALDDTTVGFLRFEYLPSALLFMTELQTVLFTAGSVILLVAFFLFFLLTRKTFFIPIRYLSKALKTKHYMYIAALSKQKHELGEIARLIVEHDQQSLQLNRYTEAVDEIAIVSKTTPKGIITYVNDAFVSISGYAKEELIGKPHNIVRHPDNPPQFFYDMWQTLKHGRTWKGILKNLRKNGQTYYVKSAIIPMLNAKGEVEEFIAIRYDITDLFEQMEHLKKENVLDLPGRKMLFESVEQCLDPHLAILNICGFRDINTLHGQAFGDSVLQHLCFKIKTALTQCFQLFYLQGDEFALLCCETLSYDDFLQKCDTLLTRLNDEGLIIAGKHYAITLRMGIANGNDYTYNRAEIALEEARKSHKALVVYDDNEGFSKKLQGDIAWNETLRDALVHNRFTVFLQEIVPLNDTAERKKYEVLIRLIDRNGTIIAPFHFLDLAKRMHVYHQLTRFVIQEAIQAALELHCDVSINLAKEDILNVEIASFLLSTLHHYPMLKKRITIELLESEGIENSPEVKAFLQTARAEGCLLAIDDFGSGYSNFEYLLQLQVDFIKIDGSLIKNIDTDSNAYETVKAIVTFAKSLGIQVVAEFVHKHEVLTRVKELGIDFAQGYYLHEPAPKTKL